MQPVSAYEAIIAHWIYTAAYLVVQEHMLSDTYHVNQGVHACLATTEISPSSTLMSAA